MTEISLNAVTCQYGNQPVIRGVSFTARRGEVLALLGPSGCGKSTLINCMAQLHQGGSQLSYQGEIQLASTPLSPQSLSKDQRRRIAMIFQKPVPFPISIYKNLEVPLKEHFQLRKKERQEEIQKALKQVGLWEEVKGRLHAPALQLSGGQKQRLCLARALILNPDIWLLDEPCSALDPISMKQIERLILDLAKTKVVVLVTHNLAQARRLAQQLVVLWQDNGCGYVLEKGATEDLFVRAESPLARAYLAGEEG